MFPRESWNDYDQWIDLQERNPQIQAITAI